jgi:hypothetical protein
VGPETAERVKLARLVPLAHVADVRKAMEFYQLLGFEVKKTVEDRGHPGAQDVLFYMYASDVAAYRAELEAKGVKAGPISYPFYSPRGEFRVNDPDGYTLMVAHAD